MANWQSILLPGLCFLNTACSQAQPEAAKPSAIVHLTNPEVGDFGIAREGSTTRLFHLKNESSEFITLDPPRVSCACNKVTYSAPQISPGGSIEVSAIVSGRADSSTVHSRVFIPWRSEAHQGEVEVVCKGKFVPLLEFSPPVLRIANTPGAKVECLIRAFPGSNIIPMTARHSFEAAAIRMTQSAEQEWRMEVTWNGLRSVENRLTPIYGDSGSIIVQTNSTFRPIYRVPLQFERQVTASTSAVSSRNSVPH